MEIESPFAGVHRDLLICLSEDIVHCLSRQFTKQGHCIPR